MPGPPLEDHKQKPAKVVQNKNLLFFFEAQMQKESIFNLKNFQPTPTTTPPQTVAQAGDTFFQFQFSIASHPPNQWPPT